MILLMLLRINNPMKIDVEKEQIHLVEEKIRMSYNPDHEYIFSKEMTGSERILFQDPDELINDLKYEIKHKRLQDTTYFVRESKKQAFESFKSFNIFDYIMRISSQSDLNEIINQSKHHLKCIFVSNTPDITISGFNMTQMFDHRANIFAYVDHSGDLLKQFHVSYPLVAIYFGQRRITELLVLETVGSKIRTLFKDSGDLNSPQTPELSYKSIQQGHLRKLKELLEKAEIDDHEYLRRCLMLHIRFQDTSSHSIISENDQKLYFSSIDQEDIEWLKINIDQVAGIDYNDKKMIASSSTEQIYNFLSSISLEKPSDNLFVTRKNSEFTPRLNACFGTIKPGASTKIERFLIGGSLIANGMIKHFNVDKEGNQHIIEELEFCESTKELELALIRHLNSILAKHFNGLELTQLFSYNELFKDFSRTGDIPSLIQKLKLFTEKQKAKKRENITTNAKESSNDSTFGMSIFAGESILGDRRRKLDSMGKGLSIQKSNPKTPADNQSIHSLNIYSEGGGNSIPTKRNSEKIEKEKFKKDLRFRRKGFNEIKVHIGADMQNEQKKIGAPKHNSIQIAEYNGSARKDYERHRNTLDELILHVEEVKGPLHDKQISNLYFHLDNDSIDLIDCLDHYRSKKKVSIIYNDLLYLSNTDQERQISISPKKMKKQIYSGFNSLLKYLYEIEKEVEECHYVYILQQFGQGCPVLEAAYDVSMVTLKNLDDFKETILIYYEVKLAQSTHSQGLNEERRIHYQSLIKRQLLILENYKMYLPEKLLSNAREKISNGNQYLLTLHQDLLRNRLSQNEMLNRLYKAFSQESEEHSKTTSSNSLELLSLQKTPKKGHSLSSFGSVQLQERLENFLQEHIISENTRAEVRAVCSQKCKTLVHSILDVFDANNDSRDFLDTIDALEKITYEYRSIVRELHYSWDNLLQTEDSFEENFGNPKQLAIVICSFRPSKRTKLISLLKSRELDEVYKILAKIRQ